MTNLKKITDEMQKTFIALHVSSADGQTYLGKIIKHDGAFIILATLPGGGFIACRKFRTEAKARANVSAILNDHKPVNLAPIF